MEAALIMEPPGHVFWRARAGTFYLWKSFYFYPMWKQRTNVTAEWSYFVGILNVWTLFKQVILNAFAKIWNSPAGILMTRVYKSSKVICFFYFIFLFWLNSNENGYHNQLMTGQSGDYVTSCCRRCPDTVAAARGHDPWLKARGRKLTD